jgi:hypothetical protein
LKNSGGEKRNLISGDWKLKVLKQNRIVPNKQKIVPNKQKKFPTNKEVPIKED